jgi:pilus assembly protein Flp/PilA
MSSSWLQRILRFLRRDDGPTTVEYAVLLALITGACIGAVKALGEHSTQTYEEVAAVVGRAGFQAAAGSFTSPDGIWNFDPATGVLTNTSTGWTDQVTNNPRWDQAIGRELARAGWSETP